MEFNDNIVKNFDPKNIPNEAFGGQEKVNYNKMSFFYRINQWKYQFSNENINSRQKIRNAYLLFYDKVEKFHHEIKQNEEKNTEN